MSTRHGLAGLLACMLPMVGCVSSAPTPPPTWDGLEYRPGAEGGVLYVRPGIASRRYRTVVIDRPHVFIDEEWDPVVGTIPVGPVGQGMAPRHLSDREVRRIEDVLAGEVRKLLAKDLTAAGYTVLERPADDTMLVTSALVDVDLAGGYGGRMTLVLELRDAATGHSLARLVDRRTGDMGVLQFPDSVTEHVNFRRAVDAWTRQLLAAIETVSL